MKEADFYILDAAADWRQFFMRFVVQRQQYADQFVALGTIETMEMLSAELDNSSLSPLIEFICLDAAAEDDALMTAALPGCRLALAPPESLFADSPYGKKIAADLLARTVILLPDMLARFLDDPALAEALVASAPRLTLIAGPDAEQLPLARRCYRQLKDRHREDRHFKLNYHDLRKTRQAP